MEAMPDMAGTDPAPPPTGPVRSDQPGPAGAVLRRRTLLGLLGAGAAGAAVGGAAVAVATDAAGPGGDATAGASVVPFYGPHQAGLATPAQSNAVFLGLDLQAAADEAQVRGLLQRWTPLAAGLTGGRPHPADPLPLLTAAPSRLTVTVGFGPGFFDRVGRPQDRPAGVAVLPPFQGDELQPELSEGDLLLQICGDDAVAVAHAADVLAAAALPQAQVRWRQAGFLNAAAVAAGQTPRNLMGNKDGTANDEPGSERFERTVWADGPEYPAWFAGGTTLVLRRIRMDLPSWVQAGERTQERVVGRRMDSGAPLGAADEFDPVPLTAQGPDGRLVVPSSAHVRIAHPDTNRGARMFRRGYNYVDGGERGLLFVALQADATRGFLPVMARMAVGDDLNRFVQHVGSAVFAVPPGVPEGGFWGQQLLG
jgi:dye decolorizing peroxidase